MTEQELIEKLIRLVGINDSSYIPNVTKLSAAISTLIKEAGYCYLRACRVYQVEEMERLSDEESKKTWETAFDKPVFLDHKPTPEEIFIIRLRAIAQAQYDADLRAHKESLRQVFKDLEGGLAPDYKSETGSDDSTMISDWFLANVILQSLRKKWLGEEK